MRPYISDIQLFGNFSIEGLKKLTLPAGLTWAAPEHSAVRHCKTKAALDREAAGWGLTKLEASGFWVDRSWATKFLC